MHTTQDHMIPLQGFQVTWSNLCSVCVTLQLNIQFNREVKLIGYAPTGKKNGKKKLDLNQTLPYLW